MTLLRRAPREVYRVYDEQEFFAEDARGEHVLGAGRQAGSLRLHRVAGATIVLAVTGAVGGVIAIAGTPSSGGRSAHRVSTRLLAATGSLLAARGRVWHAPAGARGPRRGSSQAALARDVKHTRALASAANGAREQVRSLASTAAPKLARAPVDREALASVARNVASASAGVASAPADPRQPRQSEFGFER